MLRYSFIDTNLNDPNKQCFCIDVNTSKSPFVYADNINPMNKLIEQSFLLKPLVQPVVPISSQPISSHVSNDALSLVKQSSTGDFAQAANDLNFQNLENNSLTKDNQSKVARQIDLNKMANVENKVYKKVKKEDDKKYSLMEDFDCESDCVVQKPNYYKKQFRMHRYMNENTYLFIIILLLLLLSYMTRKI